MFEVLVFSLLSSVAEQPFTPPEIYFPDYCECAIVIKEIERPYAEPNFDADLYPDYVVQGLRKGLIDHDSFLPGNTRNHLIMRNPIDEPLQ